jgi:hypothetical protein
LTKGNPPFVRILMCLKYKKTTSRSLLSREDNGFIEEIY